MRGDFGFSHQSKSVFVAPSNAAWTVFPYVYDVNLTDAEKTAIGGLSVSIAVPFVFAIIVPFFVFWTYLTGSLFFGLLVAGFAVGIFVLPTHLLLKQIRMQKAATKKADEVAR